MRTDLMAIADLHDICKSDEEMDAAAEKTTTLEEGKTYKVRADIGNGFKWYTVIRRTMNDGSPSIYYVEDDFEDYYYEDEAFLTDDVREI